MKFGLRLRRELVLDIGSSHTVVASQRQALPFRFPTQVSIAAEYVRDPQSGEKGVAGARTRDPSRKKEVVVFPVERGKIVHVYAMERLLKTVLARAGGRWKTLGVRSLGGLIVPPNLEEEQKSRLRALLVDVGFSKVRLLEAPFAAAKGCGLQVGQARGIALMDFGGGKFSFAVLSLGGVVAWNEEPFGGQDLDRAIMDYVWNRYKATITAKVAEEVKLAIGSVFPPQKPQSLTVAAFEQHTDVPRRLRLEDNEIRDLLVDACEPLMQGLQRSFADVPPELAGDIAAHGVTLLGGGSLLEGLPAFLRERTGLDFRVAQDPLNATVLGAQGLLSSGFGAE